MTALKNRELLYALYRHAWELKEELVLVGKYLNWLKSGPEPGQTYATPERRQKICRGGLVADLQRLLPMDDKGRFRDQHRRDADEVTTALMPLIILTIPKRSATSSLAPT